MKQGSYRVFMAHCKAGRAWTLYKFLYLIISHHPYSPKINILEI